MKTLTALVWVKKKGKASTTSHLTKMRAVNVGRAVPEILCCSAFKSLATILIYCLQIKKRKMQNKHNVYPQMSYCENKFAYMFVIQFFITEGNVT